MVRLLGVVWLVSGCGHEMSWVEAAPTSDLQIDDVLQVSAPAVDVLWVFDNSGSMERERSAIAASFDEFAAPFLHGGTDVHVGVVSTEMDRSSHQGNLVEVDGRRWAESGDPDFAQTFARMATSALEESKSFREQGRAAAHAALEKSAPRHPNQGFLRQGRDAWLHIVVVSDEDDDSSAQRLPESAFIDYLRWLRPLPERVTFNSVIDDDPTSEYYGASYARVTEAVGGIVESVHTDDWRDLLSVLGSAQAPAPADEFFLSEPPRPGSIEVSVRLPGEDWQVRWEGDDYAYLPERNSVWFVAGAVPPLGSEIRLAYLAW